MRDISEIPIILKLEDYLIYSSNIKLRYFNLKQLDKTNFTNYEERLFNFGNFSDQVVINKAQEIKELVNFTLDV